MKAAGTCSKWKEGRLPSWCTHHPFLVLFAFSLIVYLLTMDRSVSWWDSGEFIATGWTLGVGHPPGAPFYQLLAHLFMLLSFGNPLWIAPLSNALSVLCGALTVALLGSTLRLMGARPFAAIIGALCYLFCDTAWFSAVESEVYAPAMLFCSLDVYLALRYRQTRKTRLLPLLALLLGLGIGVHLMTLLVVPALALIVLSALGQPRWTKVLKVFLFSFLFFLMGLTPYAIVPVRAAANPPINEMRDDLGSYLRRDQYPKAPLYPRMWRERDSANWGDWNLGRTDVIGNTVYCCGYQLGYMYARYLMYNFLGRENLRWNCVVIFVLPGLLGLWGLWCHRRRNRRDYWVVMLLFLFGGPLLNLYLNHPCYEPRERDYVYILSFYAFALWIGLGADSLPRRRWLHILALLTPLTLAVGNWSDHDRHNCHSVHDIAAAHLLPCAPDAILVTLGDNDTFPLWYLQQVEGLRPDVSVYNVGLTGWKRTIQLIGASDRPVYFTQYFVDRYAALFPGRLQCEGFCWRLVDEPGVSAPPLFDDWHITSREYLPAVSRNFLAAWQRNTGHAVPLR